MAKVPKKIAGVKTPVFVLALAGLIIVGLVLRSRYAAASTSSGAGGAPTTLDTGLGSGGAGAVSTPTDNGLGSTTVGTDSLTSGVLGAYESGFQSLLDANLQMAANAGSYYSTNTTTSYTYNNTGGSSGVTTPNGYSVPHPPTPIFGGPARPPLEALAGTPPASPRVGGGGVPKLD